MTFDLAKVPGGDVAAWGAERRDKALSGVRDGDWRSIYDWTKSWTEWGDDAWLPAPGSCTPSRRSFTASAGAP